MPSCVVPVTFITEYTGVKFIPKGNYYCLFTGDNKYQNNDSVGEKLSWFFKHLSDGLYIFCSSVRTNHSSGRPRRVKTAQGRVKLTHQSSDRTSANFVWKKHHQPTFHETTATNSHSIRTLNSIPEAAILSLLVHMLSCAWWERSVQFCLVPCNECRQCGIELSNHGPVSRGLPLNGSTAHKPTTTYVVDKQVSDLRCQLETYPWPSPINGGSSGCNLDFAIINTCQGNIISSKKTEHGSVLSSTEAVGDNWACQTHGDQVGAGLIFSGHVRVDQWSDFFGRGPIFSGHRSWNVWWWFWKLRWDQNTGFSLFLMSYSL